MFCYKCGHQVADDAKFCGNCGTQLLGIDDAPPVVARNIEPMAWVSPKQAKSKKLFSRWWFWAIVIVAALAVIANSDNSDTGTSSPSQLNNTVQPTEGRFSNIETAPARTESSAEPANVSVDSAIVLIENTLDDNFENFEVYYENGIIFVNVWQDGIAGAAMVASSGDQEFLASWDDLISSQIRLSNSLDDLVEALGLTDVSVAINVLNDMNTENVLLTVMNGIVFYDAVNDSE